MGFGAQYAAKAYVAVSSALKKFKAKKSDDEALRASDNATAALVQLMLSHPSLSPNLDACWEMAFSKMPFKVDHEEGQKLHWKMFVATQNTIGAAGSGGYGAGTQQSTTTGGSL